MQLLSNRYLYSTDTEWEISLAALARLGSKKYAKPSRCEGTLLDALSGQIALGIAGTNEVADYWYVEDKLDYLVSRRTPIVVHTNEVYPKVWAFSRSIKVEPLYSLNCPQYNQPNHLVVFWHDNEFLRSLVGQAKAKELPIRLINIPDDQSRMGQQVFGHI